MVRVPHCLLSCGQVGTVDHWNVLQFGILPRSRPLALGSFALLAMLSAFPAVAQPTSAHRAVSLANIVTPGSEFTGADLDGDRQFDIVVSPSFPYSALSASHSVEIRLSTSRGKQTLHVPCAQGGFSVTARDVDGDLDLDLVFTSSLTGEGISVWMNDGDGVFSEGDAANRQPWVWGQGAQLRAGLPVEEPSDALSASSDELVVPQVIAAPLTLYAFVSLPSCSRSVSSQTRGAFYIRPPPASLL